MRRFLAALSVAAGFVLACSSPRAEGGAPIVVSGAVARLAPGMGAVYLTIQNNTETEDRLVSVEAPGAMVELHETVAKGEVMQMIARPEGFVVPAQGSIALQEGGKHLMVMGADPAAHPGGLPLTLVFARAGRVSATAPLASLGGK